MLTHYDFWPFSSCEIDTNVYPVNPIQYMQYMHSIPFLSFWLPWVFIAVSGLSLAAESGGYSWLRWAGFSLRWLLLLCSTESRVRGFQKLRHTSSVVTDRGLRCSTACGVAPEQASNPHWQVDSQSTVPPGKSMSAVLASCVVSKCVNRSKFNKIPSQWVLQSSLLYLQCLIQLAHQYYESF